MVDSVGSRAKSGNRFRPIADIYDIPHLARMQSSTDPISRRQYQLSFSDEFDEATFDLSGRSFRLDFVSVHTRTIGQVTTRLYEFSFIGEPIRDRAGAAVFGNLFIALSPRLESSDGPWGASVVAFDASDEMVPVGRAHLAVSSKV